MSDDFDLEESIEEEEIPAPAKKAKKPKKAKKDKVEEAAPAKPRAKKRERDEFGLAVGSVRSRAAALYAREEGATLKEVEKEVGVIQHNVITKLKKAGFEFTETAEAGEKNRTVTRFFLHRK